RRAGHVRAAGRLYGLDRAAAARSLDQTDQREAQLVRHLLTLEVLALDRGIGGSAAHGEVVAADHDGPSVEPGSAEDEVRWNELLEVVLLVVRRAACDLADLVKAPRIDQQPDSLPDRVPPAFVLPLHPLRAAQLLGERFAAPELVHLRLPVHARSPLCRQDECAWEAAGRW